MNIYLKVLSINYLIIYFSLNFINNLYSKHRDNFEMYLILIQIHQHSNIIIIISFSIIQFVNSIY